LLALLGAHHILHASGIRVKKGNKTEMSNYRPLSFLTFFSKVFEKVIYER
jgi:hypothetical protein